MADVAKGTSPYVPDACMPSDAAVPGYMVSSHTKPAPPLIHHSSHIKEPARPGERKVAGVVCAGRAGAGNVLQATGEMLNVFTCRWPLR